MLEITLKHLFDSKLTACLPCTADPRLVIIILSQFVAPSFGPSICAAFICIDQRVLDGQILESKPFFVTRWPLSQSSVGYRSFHLAFSLAACFSPRLLPVSKASLPIGPLVFCCVHTNPTSILHFILPISSSVSSLIHPPTRLVSLLCKGLLLFFTLCPLQVGRTRRPLAMVYTTTMSAPVSRSPQSSQLLTNA